MTAVLAIDQGTSASKAAVFDRRGRAIGFGRVALRTRFGANGEAHQDPAEILRTTRRAIRQAMSQAGWPRLESAGIASQRSTFVLWDRDSGRAVAPAPTWQSTEAAALCDRFRADEPRIRRRTGLPLSPHYSASKLARLLAGSASLRRAARDGRVLFGPTATFVLWHLTGGASHHVDPTLAARTLLCDLNAAEWDPWLLSRFDVPAAMLPRVRPSLSSFGMARCEGREVPVQALLGDQQAALLGAVGLHEAGRPGAAMVNYGTGAFVLAPTGRRVARRDGLLTSFAWTDAGSRRHVLEGTVNAAGSTLDWLRERFGAPADLEAIGKMCRRSRGELVMVPAFRGLGSAHMGPRDAGLGALVASRAGGAPWSLADLTAAAVASIAHGVTECLDLARRAGSAAAGGRVIASGPLTRLRPLVTWQAALLGHEMEIARREEATLAGVASAATQGRLFPSGSPTRREPRPTRAICDEARDRHEAWLALIEAGRRWSAPSRRPA